MVEQKNQAAFEVNSRNDPLKAFCSIHISIFRYCPSAALLLLRPRELNPSISSNVRHQTPDTSHRHQTSQAFDNRKKHKSFFRRLSNTIGVNEKPEIVTFSGIFPVLDFLPPKTRSLSSSSSSFFSLLFLSFSSSFSFHRVHIMLFLFLLLLLLFFQLPPRTSQVRKAFDGFLFLFFFPCSIPTCKTSGDGSVDSVGLVFVGSLTLMLILILILILMPCPFS